ncbi:MAG: hypothetical protein HY646_01780 [Acidobacteria bacterium]|nr:hypothetical protein [Acidobacteriota bacterium]
MTILRTTFRLSVLIALIFYTHKSAQATQDVAAVLRQEAASLRPKEFHLGPPFGFPAELTSRAKSFRERIQQYTQTHAGTELNADWFAAARDSFMYSSVSEWSRYDLAKTGLVDWWAVLAKAQPAETNIVADLCLSMASLHLQGWAQVEPEACLKVLYDSQRAFYGNASDAQKADWKWWVARFAETFQRVAKNLPPDRRAALLVQTSALFDGYAADESVPREHRTHAMVSRARTLYAEGNPVEAVRLLDGWLRKHGDKITSMEFYALRFCVACLGQGDRRTAQDMVQRATHLVANGVAPANDANYSAMIAVYYRNLFSTDVELKRKASLFTAELKAKTTTAAYITRTK